MTIDKVQSLSSASPPIHVHVDQETPVHVHVKKGAKKSASAIAVEEKLKASKNRFNVTLGSTGNLRPSNSARGPWVPAPGRSTKGQKFSWNQIRFPHATKRYEASAFLGDLQPSSRPGQAIRSPPVSAQAREKLKASKNRFIVTLGSTGNLRPSNSARGPWVPAPGRSTKGQKFSWNGAGARLDIQPPTRDGSSSTMRMEDLRDGDNRADEQYRDYEDRIGTLMTEVGSLKTQREVERSKRAADRA
eukprot:XP_011663936.1 PREDICTED: outer dense fiber protein 2-like [Strongylocentrotus purpuratus]